MNLLGLSFPPIPLLLSSLARVAHAIPQPCADPTPKPSLIPTRLLSNDVIQATTTSPPKPELRRGELQQRQYVDTCGYANADLNLALTCGYGYECAQNNYYTAIGCCPAGALQNCQLPTTCIGYSDYSTNCDFDCQADLAIGKCSDAYYPYCATIRSINGYSTFQGYICATAALIVTIEPTYTNYGVPDGTIKVGTVTETYIPPSSAVGAQYVNYGTINTGPVTNSGGKDGLSTGEIIGIVAGVVGAVATVITVVIMCRRGH